VRNSLLGKMIGAHLTVIVIVFLTLFVAVSYLMEYYFHRAKERELVHNAAELAESLARFPDPVGPEVLAVIGTFQQFTGTTVWIVDSAGRIVTPSRDALERAGEVMAALAEETPAAVPAPGDFGLDGFISWRDWDPDTGQPLLSVAVPLRRDDAAAPCTSTRRWWAYAAPSAPCAGSWSPPASWPRAPRPWSGWPSPGASRRRCTP